MRLLYMAIVLFAAAGTADVLFYDGENGRAFWQEVNDQGRQMRYAIDSFVHQYILP